MVGDVLMVPVAVDPPPPEIPKPVEQAWPYPAPSEQLLQGAFAFWSLNQINGAADQGLEGADVDNVTDHINPGEGEPGRAVRRRAGLPQHVRPRR